MKPMTPMDARRSLTYAEEHDGYMAIGHRRALETIAGMRTEYQVQRQFTGEWYPCQLELGITWTDDKAVADEYADTCRTQSIPVRIVRRYVTNEEEA